MSFTMLPTNKHVEDVYYGPTGLATRLNKDCLLVDSSTISPLAARNLSIKLRNEFDLEFVDAPVSGGVFGADKATLCFMIGADSPALFEVRRLMPAQQGPPAAHGGQFHQLQQALGGTSRQDLQ